MISSNLRNLGFTVSILFLMVGAVSVDQVSHESKPSHQWLVRILTNGAFYMVILLPLFLLRLYLKWKNIPQKLKSGERRHCMSGFVQICFVADIEEFEKSSADAPEESSFLPLPVTSSSKKPAFDCILRLRECFGLNLSPADRTPKQRYVLLTVCALGLQLSYVMWGIMQERIMARDYDGQMFEYSQFLVFCNRIITLFIIIPLQWLRLGVECNPFKPGHRAPFFEFAFASASNIVSSWCQYEALKYITFPTQVISKACKVIPVMVMGWFVQRRTYSLLEYITAGLISIGLSMFMLSDSTERSARTNRHLASQWTALSGGFLIVIYLLMDSFTSNWQDRLFRKYNLSSVQVMTGVNMWSVILTSVPLICEGTMVASIQFGIAHREFFLDAIASALCSAVGQLFIFLTISQFGPATFVLIMTLRMGFSLLLSCILFGHAFSISGILGVCLVFTALFARMYWRSKTKPKNVGQTPPPQKPDLLSADTTISVVLHKP